jgi:hypothetical protein
MNLGKYFAENGKQITELTADDCIIVGKLVNGKFVQKYILVSDANFTLPQDLDTNASPTFENIQIGTKATINELELGQGNPVTVGAVTPNKKIEIKINGVDYFIALEEIE